MNVFDSANLQFNEFGVMLCAGPLKLPTIRKFVSLIASFGYNTLWLEVSGEIAVDEKAPDPHAFTPQELAELKQYCAQNGVTLVPSIQTLGHMGHIQRNPAYAEIFDKGEVLLVDEPKTYEYLDRFLGAVSQVFDGGRINIGMDEAYDLGLGRYLNQHGFVERGELFTRHLNKVVELAKKHRLTPSMWGDMLKDLKREYKANSPITTKDYTKLVPSGVVPYEWIYEGYDLGELNNILDNYKEIPEIGFCSGAWQWAGYAPNNAYSMSIYPNHATICKKRGITRFLVSLWGDSYAATSVFAVLPALFTASLYAHGRELDDTAKAEFERLTGLSFDTAMLADIPNLNITPQSKNNKHRFALYNNPLDGTYDSLLSEGMNEQYHQCAELLSRVNGSFYDYHFQMLAQLCRVLSLKTELGLHLRKYYQAGNNTALRAEAEKIPVILKECERFFELLETQYEIEQRPGWYAAQVKNAGILKENLEYAYTVLMRYLDGKIEKIIQLENKQLPQYTGEVDSHPVFPGNGDNTMIYYYF